MPDTTANQSPETYVTQFCHVSLFALEAAGARSEGARLGIYRSLHSLAAKLELPEVTDKLANVVADAEQANVSEDDFESFIRETAGGLCK